MLRVSNFYLDETRRGVALGSHNAELSQDSRLCSLSIKGVITGTIYLLILGCYK